MKKLILIVALFFLLITYGNYRKQQILSRVEDYKPKPKRARALSYEEMAARKRAIEAKNLFQKVEEDTTLTDSLEEIKIIIPDTIRVDSIKYDSLRIILVIDSLTKIKEINSL